jgi:hypothetical protein
MHTKNDMVLFSADAANSKEKSLNDDDDAADAKKPTVRTITNFFPLMAGHKSFTKSR